MQTKGITGLDGEAEVKIEENKTDSLWCHSGKMIPRFKTLALFLFVFPALSVSVEG